MVVDEERDRSALSDAAAVVLEVDANAGRAGCQRFGTRDFVPLMRHVVVLEDRLPVLDVQGVSAGRSAFSHEHSIRAPPWHFDRGGNGVRLVLGVGRRGLGDYGPGVVAEIRPSGDQAWPQARIAALREAVVERENVVLLCLDPEVILQLFQLLRIFSRDVVRFAEVVRKLVELPGVMVEVPCAPTHRYPRESPVTGRGDPTIFVERAVTEHLEVLDVARVYR